MKDDEFPKVIVQNGNIIIIYNRNKKILWGIETNLEKATIISKEIEMGLRSINYAKFKLIKVIEEIADYLLEKKIPEEMLDEIIGEAIGDTFRMLPNICRKIAYNIKNR